MRKNLPAGTANRRGSERGADLRRGEEYLGHLVAVSDAQGHIVDIKTDVSWPADKTEALREIYLRGEVSKYLRHFTLEMVRTEAPRPQYYESRAN